MRIGDITFTATLEVNIDEVFLALHKEATEAKRGKDWDRAIDCLRRANARPGGAKELDKLLRLPLFLQQAGRFDEAMAEFSRIVAAVRPSVERDFSHLPANGRRAVVASHLMRVYDKIRLACQRGGRMADAEKYRLLHDKWAAIHRQLHSLSTRDRSKQQLKQALRNRRTHPYVRYLVGDRCCDRHGGFAGLALSPDHPFWSEHLPPADPDCHCGIISMSQRDFDKAMRDGITRRYQESYIDDKGRQRFTGVTKTEIVRIKTSCQ